MRCQHLQPLPLLTLRVFLQECCQQSEKCLCEHAWVCEVGGGRSGIKEALVLSSEGCERSFKSSDEEGTAGVLIGSRR